jgi:hypothetical protein
MATATIATITMIAASAREAEAQSALDATRATDCVMPNAREQICGRLDRLDPDRRDLVIRMADGAVRHVSWYEIVTAWGPSFPPRRTGRDADVALPGTVHVEFESVGEAQTVQLAWADAVPSNPDARAGSAGTLRRAECTTPCALRIAPGAVAARVAGREEAPRSVMLSIPTSDVRIRLQAPSQARMRAADVLSGGGLAVMLAGAIYPVWLWATGGSPSSPTEERLLWGSLGLEVAGGASALSAVMLDPPRGVASVERLCRTIAIGAPSGVRPPWEASPRESPRSSRDEGRAPGVPVGSAADRYVLCR